MATNMNQSNQMTDAEYVVQTQENTTVQEIRNALSELDEETEINSFRIGLPVHENVSVGYVLQTVEDLAGKSEEAFSHRSQNTGAENEEEKHSEQQAVETEIEQETDESHGVVDGPSREKIFPEDLNLERPDIYDIKTLESAAENVGIDYTDEDNLVKILRNYVESSQSAEQTEDESQTLRTGNNRYYLMHVLYEEGGWMRTREIKDAMPNDIEMTSNTLGSTLWQLSDKEEPWVEKQPYEKDKRQKEYRLTEKGKQIIEETIEKSDDSDLKTITAD